MGKQSARIYFRGKDHKEIYYQGHYHDAMYIGNTLVWEKLKTEQDENYKYIVRLPYLYTFHNGRFYIVFSKWGKNEKEIDNNAVYLGYYICDSYDMHKINSERKINMDESDIDTFFRGTESNSYTIAEGSDNLNFLKFNGEHVYGYYFEDYDISRPIKKGLKEETSLSNQNTGVKPWRYNASHVFADQHVLHVYGQKIYVEDGLGSILNTISISDVKDIYFDGYSPILSYNYYWLPAFTDKICVFGGINYPNYDYEVYTSEYLSVVAFILDKSGNFVWYRKSPQIHDDELEEEMLEYTKTVFSYMWKYANSGGHDYTPEILEVYCDAATSRNITGESSGYNKHSYFVTKDTASLYSNRYVAKIKYMSNPYKSPPVWMTRIYRLISTKQGYKLTITEDDVLYEKCSFGEITSKRLFFERIIKAVYIPGMDDYAYLSCSGYVVTVTIAGEEYTYSLDRVDAIKYSNSIFTDGKRIYMLYSKSLSANGMDIGAEYKKNQMLIFDIANRTFEETNTALYKEELWN